MPTLKRTVWTTAVTLLGASMLGGCSATGVNQNRSNPEEGPGNLPSLPEEMSMRVKRDYGVSPPPTYSLTPKEILPKGIAVWAALSDFRKEGTSVDSDRTVMEVAKNHFDCEGAREAEDKGGIVKKEFIEKWRGHFVKALRTVSDPVGNTITVPLDITLGPYNSDSSSFPVRRISRHIDTFHSWFEVWSGCRPPFKITPNWVALNEKADELLELRMDKDAAKSLVKKHGRAQVAARVEARIEKVKIKRDHSDRIANVWLLVKPVGPILVMPAGEGGPTWKMPL